MDDAKYVIDQKFHIRFLSVVQPSFGLYQLIIVGAAVQPR